jgi:hypothetical protein
LAKKVLRRLRAVSDSHSVAEMRSRKAEFATDDDWTENPNIFGGHVKSASTNCVLRPAKEPNNRCVFLAIFRILLGLGLSAKLNPAPNDFVWQMTL